MGLFILIFGSFKHLCKFYFINEKNNLSSMWCWDLNSRPHRHESPSMTTRPGHPPKKL